MEPYDFEINTHIYYGKLSLNLTKFSATCRFRQFSDFDGFTLDLLEPVNGVFRDATLQYHNLR